MKVIVVGNVKSLGKVGDVVNVSEGYARNFLIPQALVLEATDTNLKNWERKKLSASLKLQKEKKDAGILAQTLSGKTVSIKKKVGEQNRLFGSVTTREIHEAIIATIGIDIDKKTIVIDDSIKITGEFSITIKLPMGEMARMSVIVEGEA